MSHLSEFVLVLPQHLKTTLRLYVLLGYAYTHHLFLMISHEIRKVNSVWKLLGSNQHQLSFKQLLLPLFVLYYPIRCDTDVVNYINSKYIATVDI